jgi:peptidyl-prolyl cis-trans isomerase A (cyclophilin A)
MTLHLALLIAALFVPSAALAQAPQLAAPAQGVAAKQPVRVALQTKMGRIVLALDAARAPKAVANFLHYVDSGKLNGESFYRAMPYGSGGLIQGGITTNARKLADPVEHEPVSVTGIKHAAGTVSMANVGPGTARSDFFILTSDVPAFDQSFAAFGRVVEGMDVVKAILAAPVSPTKGEGPMRGQMLEPAVRIENAERLPSE